MSKITVYILLSIGLLLILVISNPKEQAHKDAVKSKVNSVFQKSLMKTESSDGIGEIGQGLGLLFGGLLIEKLVDNYITCDNYLLFSLTKAAINDEPRTIGFGFLGNVFISSEIKNVLNSSLNNKDKSEIAALEKNEERLSESEVPIENTEVAKNKVEELDISVRSKFSEWENYLIEHSIFDCVTKTDCDQLDKMTKLYENGKYPMHIENPTYVSFEINGDGVDDYVITYGLENCVNGNGWTKDFVILISESRSAYRIDKDLANDLKTKFLGYATNTVGKDAYVYLENGYIQAQGLNIDEIRDNKIYGTFDLIGNGVGRWPEIKGTFYYDLISRKFSISKLDE